jgi:hypothetical protein
MDRRLLGSQCCLSTGLVANGIRLTKRCNALSIRSDVTRGLPDIGKSFTWLVFVCSGVLKKLFILSKHGTKANIRSTKMANNRHAYNRDVLQSYWTSDPVIPLLPCFDRFLVISIFERKKGVDVGEEIYLIK